MTTFASREAIRDELVAGLTATGLWVAVYGYSPAPRAVVGSTPFAIVRGRGTMLEMQGQVSNPVTHRFVISSWVLAEDGQVSSADAEDTADNISRGVLQYVRDNASGGTHADMYTLDDFSDVRDTVVENVPYIAETFTLVAHLYKGAV